MLVAILDIALELLVLDVILHRREPLELVFLGLIALLISSLGLLDRICALVFAVTLLLSNASATRRSPSSDAGVINFRIFFGEKFPSK